MRKTAVPSSGSQQQGTWLQNARGTQNPEMHKRRPKSRLRFLLALKLKLLEATYAPSTQSWCPTATLITPNKCLLLSGRKIPPLPGSCRRAEEGHWGRWTSWRHRIFFLALAVLVATVLWALILSVLLSEASSEREALLQHQDALSTNASKHATALDTLKKEVGACGSCCKENKAQLQKAVLELAATQAKLLEQESALKELTTRVTQEVAKASRDRENIRSELYRALDNTKVQNGSCEPCPDKWLLFEGSCYFFSERPDTWEQAQQQCALISGHLVIVGGLEEQGFLSRNLQYKYGYWLGLRAVRRRGRIEGYQWVDGVPLSFSHWNTGEPNDSRGQEDCVMMLDSGLWNDAPCGNTRDNWICEKRRSC